MNSITRLYSQGGLIAVHINTGGTETPIHADQHGTPRVTATEGQEYRLRAVNLTGAPLEVLAAIDQRDVLTTATADLHQNRGHLIGPGGAYTWPGWRRNDRETQPFVFTVPEASVAMHATGTTAGTGVIGFAAYREHPADDVLTAAAFPAARGTGVAAAAVATGIGEEIIYSPVTRVAFRRAPGEPDVVVIRYGTAAGLREMGIPGPARPDPFPAASTGYETYPAVRYKR